MSFYGTVFYEFEHLFFKFKFANSNSDAIDLKIENSTMGTVADERWDTFHINGGNRWIGIQSMSEIEGDKGVTLFHTGAGDGKHSIKPLSIATGETQGTQLQTSQVLNIPTIKYDNAGHISSTDVVKYKMPDAETIVYDGLIDNFDNNFDLPIINTEIPDDTTKTIVTLTPGQVIGTPQFTVNNKGIVDKVKEIYFKLPESDAEADYNTLYERMGSAEKNINDIQVYLQENDYEALRNRVDQAEKDIDDNLKHCNDEIEKVREEYATLEHTGQIDDVYSEISLVADDKKFKSITNMIGNLESSALKINTNNAGKSVSVSEQLMAIQQFALDQAGAYNISNTLFTNELQDLKDRVSLLEEKIN